jgi:ABC-type amino acid transport substrate-binding protein
MKRTTAVVLAMALAGALGAASLLAPGTSAQAPAAAHDGKTVYIDISALGRKHRAAEKMTEMHVKMAADGYVVVDVADYVENGDLQGFFVTYAK